MASYIDAGSIVALAAGLALWQEYLGMSSTTVGLLAAFGPNAFGAALGALIGGRLGDLLGRKRIYQYDLLVYAFGTLLIVFSVNLPMLLIGTFIVGVAVGADVPTSLALIGEFSPSKARGKLLGLSQIAWSLGPIVVYVLAFALSPYDVLGNRIVFAHLFVVAIVTWALRQGMVESARWTAASGAAEAERTSDPEEQPEEAPVPADRWLLVACATYFPGRPWRRSCSP
jgi:MFS transporter, SP family, inositol transporter